MSGQGFNPMLEGLKLSPIVITSELARQKAASFHQTTGKNFVHFHRGEVDFPTPDYIKQAARAALDQDRTKYPKSGGEDDLKDAIVQKLHDTNRASGLKGENVLCTYGAQEALQLSFKLFAGTKGAGFSPCWSCILENLTPYESIDFTLVPLGADFGVDWAELEKVLKEVRFFYLNNPQNPTGKVFSEAEVRTIAELCQKNGVWLISDETYEQIVYDGLEHFSAASIEQENIIAVFSFSKSYSMTGWRLGYLVTRQERIPNILRLADYSQTAGVVPFIQYAGKEALANRAQSDRAISAMVGEFQRRRDVLHQGLSAIDGIRVEKPGGAFYVFPSFTELIPSELTGPERELYVAHKLMEHGVAVVHGACFGIGFEDNIRISFSTTPVSAVEAGVRRIEQAFRSSS
ncbi:MAG: aminotransferase class I/II-fold pyridoxal phosphate-dependent enzyme [Anaerolineae bacterium]